MGRSSLSSQNAASAPWRPSNAGAGVASHPVMSKTVQFGGCSPPPLWEMQHRARGAGSAFAGKGGGKGGAGGTLSSISISAAAPNSGSPRH